MNEITIGQYQAYQALFKEGNPLQCDKNLNERINALECDFEYVNLLNFYSNSESNLCLCGHYIQDINILQLNKNIAVVIGNECLKKFICKNKNKYPEIMDKLEEDKKNINKWYCYTCKKLHNDKYVCNKVICYICDKKIKQEDSYKIRDDISQVLCNKHEKLRYVNFTKHKGEFWIDQSNSFIIWCCNNKWCKDLKSKEEWKLYKQILQLIILYDEVKKNKENMRIYKEYSFGGDFIR